MRLPVIFFHFIIPLGIVLALLKKNFMTFAVNAYYFNNSKNAIFMFSSDSSVPHERQGPVSRMSP